MRYLNDPPLIDVHQPLKREVGGFTLIGALLQRRFAMNGKILCSALLALGASFAAPAGASFLTATGQFDSFSCSGTGTVTCIDDTNTVTTGANGVFLDGGFFSFDAGAGNVLTSLEVLIGGNAVGIYAVGFHGGGLDGSRLFAYNESTSSYTAGKKDWSFGPTTLFSSGSSEFASFLVGGDGQTMGKNLTQNEVEFIANVAAVPEPSEWALMLVGAAMIGGLVYRRRAPGYAPLPA
jgi:hypothetical protein